MLHDIFATSMSGTYETRMGDELVERGSWSYRGYGNAEIALEASGERISGGRMFSVRLHSVELQADQFAIASWTGVEEQERIEIRGEIAGSDINLHITGAGGDLHEGRVSVPEETVYGGPSPIWLIYQMIATPVPDDRVITTPFVRFGLDADDTGGGFYRVSRSGLHIVMTELDEDGAEIGRLDVDVADDGCPTIIRHGDLVTTVTRVPRVAGL